MGDRYAHGYGYGQGYNQSYNRDQEQGAGDPHAYGYGYGSASSAPTQGHRAHQYPEYDRYSRYESRPSYDDYRARDYAYPSTSYDAPRPGSGYAYTFGRDQYRPQDTYHSDQYRPQPSYHRDDHRELPPADYRRVPQEEFTFTAPAGAPSAPRMPSLPRDPYPPNGPASSQRASGLPAKPPSTAPTGPRSERLPRSYGRKPKPAPGSREILTRFVRDSTPEQLPGMNSNQQPRFREVNKLEDDSASNDESGEPVKKRAKIDLNPARPQWSNPDVYTALPPPTVTGGSRIDLVAAIRKAKNQAVNNKDADANTVAKNEDYISFDFDDNESFGGPPAPPPDLVMPTNEDMRAIADRGVDRPRKRKEREPAGIAMNMDWREDGSNSTPWFKASGFTSNSGLRLHKEIIDFCEFMSPQSHEREARHDLVQRVQDVISDFARSKDIQVKAFGSFATELYLPTADMDLVAVSSGYLRGGLRTFCQARSPMHKLGAALMRAGIARSNSLVVIPKAKVPLVKFVDSLTGLRVDISFENDSGLRCLPLLRSWVEQYPDMPKLVAIIKQMLVMHDLNEVHTGGIGGLTIICLVVSMLQLWNEDLPLERLDPSSRLSYLLLVFLDLYGNKFDYKSVGIMMNPPRYFDKEYDGHVTSVPYKENRLTIIDPLRDDNDISGGSNQIEKVFRFFSTARARIQQRLDNSDSDSVLKCVIGGSYSYFLSDREQLRTFRRTNRSAQYGSGQHLEHQHMQLPELLPPPAPPKTGSAHSKKNQKRQRSVETLTNTSPTMPPAKKKKKKAKKTKTSVSTEFPQPQHPDTAIKQTKKTGKAKGKGNVSGSNNAEEFTSGLAEKIHLENETRSKRSRAAKAERRKRRKEEGGRIPKKERKKAGRADRRRQVTEEEHRNQAEGPRKALRLRNRTIPG